MKKRRALGIRSHTPFRAVGTVNTYSYYTNWGCCNLYTSSRRNYFYSGITFDDKEPRPYDRMRSEQITRRTDDTQIRRDNPSPMKDITQDEEPVLNYEELVQEREERKRDLQLFKDGQLKMNTKRVLEYVESSNPSLVESLHKNLSKPSGAKLLESLSKDKKFIQEFANWAQSQMEKQNKEAIEIVYNDEESEEEPEEEPEEQYTPRSSIRGEPFSLAQNALLERGAAVDQILGAEAGAEVAIEEANMLKTYYNKPNRAQLPVNHVEEEGEEEYLGAGEDDLKLEEDNETNVLPTAKSDKGKLNQDNEDDEEDDIFKEKGDNKGINLWSGKKGGSLTDDSSKLSRPENTSLLRYSALPPDPEYESLERSCGTYFDLKTEMSDVSKPTTSSKAFDIPLGDPARRFYGAKYDWSSLYKAGATNVLPTAKSDLAQSHKGKPISSESISANEEDKEDDKDDEIDYEQEEKRSQLDSLITEASLLDNLNDDQIKELTIKLEQVQPASEQFKHLPPVMRDYYQKEFEIATRTFYDAQRLRYLHQTPKEREQSMYKTLFDADTYAMKMVKKAVTRDMERKGIIPDVNGAYKNLETAAMVDTLKEFLGEPTLQNDFDLAVDAFTALPDSLYDKQAIPDYENEIAKKYKEKIAQEEAAFELLKTTGGRMPGLRPVMYKQDKCQFCRPAPFRPLLDPLNIHVLSKYLTIHGLITPKRYNGNCAKHQRRLARTIKRAHYLGVITYKEGGFEIDDPFEDHRMKPTERRKIWEEELPEAVDKIVMSGMENRLEELFDRVSKGHDLDDILDGKEKKGQALEGVTEDEDEEAEEEEEEIDESEDEEYRKEPAKLEGNRSRRIPSN